MATEPTEFNPYHFDVGRDELIPVPPANTRTVLVVRLRSLWAQMVFMMIVVGAVTGMLLGPAGLFLDFVYGIVVVVPVATLVLILATLRYPHGVTRSEGARVGLVVGAISAAVLGALFLGVFCASLGANLTLLVYLVVVGTINVIGQILAGSWGAKAGFDHYLNLVSLGRPNILGRVLRERTSPLATERSNMAT